MIIAEHREGLNYDGTGVFFSPQKGAKPATAQIDIAVIYWVRPSVSLFGTDGRLKAIPFWG